MGACVLTAKTWYNSSLSTVESGAFVTFLSGGPTIFLDSGEAKAQHHHDRDANAKRSGFQSNFQTGILLSVPLPRSEAYRVKGHQMRPLIQPPPSSHCDLCGGELRLKQIESANPMLDLDNEIFVCAECGREQSYTVSHDHTMPNPKAA